MTTEIPAYGKSLAGFRRLGSSLEPERADIGHDHTPVDQFFVCNAGPAPKINRDHWRLRIGGDAVEREVELTVDDLLDLEQVTVVSWLECAGNGRTLFSTVAGHPLSEDPTNTQWTLGGLGLAVWTGPRLASVVVPAKPMNAAAFVGPSGLDKNNPEGEPVRMCLPMDKAIHEDTIVALTMNGEPLEMAHGAPARLLVPGWVGAYSVKWLDQIELSTSWIDSYRANEYYVLRNPSGQILGPATTHPVKSQLRLEWDAHLPPGPAEIFGYARSGVAPITSVEWAIDNGEWQQAELLEDLGRWAWRPFAIRAELALGHHCIRTRATDESGDAQPDIQPAHRDGILWNAVIPHPLVVVD